MEYSTGVNMIALLYDLEKYAFNKDYEAARMARSELINIINDLVGDLNQHVGNTDRLGKGKAGKKLDAIYRLVYESSDANYEDNFYASEKEALASLDHIKYAIEELNEDYYDYPAGSCIYLQKIVLNDVEDIDYCASKELISEWVPDLDVDEGEDELWCWSR